MSVNFFKKSEPSKLSRLSKILYLFAIVALCKNHIHIAVVKSGALNSSIAYEYYFWEWLVCSPIGKDRSFETARGQLIRKPPQRIRASVLVWTFHQPIASSATPMTESHTGLPWLAGISGLYSSNWCDAESFRRKLVFSHVTVFEGSTGVIHSEGAGVPIYRFRNLKRMTCHRYDQRTFLPLSQIHGRWLANSKRKGPILS